jgi:hypothetical protein
MSGLSLATWKEVMATSLNAARDLFIACVRKHDFVSLATSVEAGLPSRQPAILLEGIIDGIGVQATRAPQMEALVQQWVDAIPSKLRSPFLGELLQRMTAAVNQVEYDLYNAAAVQIIDAGVSVLEIAQVNQRLARVAEANPGSALGKMLGYDLDRGGGLLLDSLLAAGSSQTCSTLIAAAVGNGELLARLRPVLTECLERSQREFRNTPWPRAAAELLVAGVEPEPRAEALLRSGIYRVKCRSLSGPMAGRDYSFAGAMAISDILAKDEGLSRNLYRRLFDLGIAIDAADSEGGATPLFLAVASDNAAVASALLDLDADPRKKSPAGDCPVDVMRRRRAEGSTARLMAAGPFADAPPPLLLKLLASAARLAAKDSMASSVATVNSP